MDNIAFFVGFSLAVGVGLLVNSFLSSLFALIRRLDRRFRRGRLAVLGLNNPIIQAQKDRDRRIFDQDRIPWDKIYLVTTVLGLVLFWMLGNSIAGARFIFLGLPALVWLVRYNLANQQKRQMAGAVRQFLLDLRLHMSLKGSLLLGMENMAQTTPGLTPVHRALHLRLLGGSVRSGLDVLRQIAGDLKSPQLLQALQRIQSAQQSGGPLDTDRALSASIEELNEVLTNQTDEQMQHLPLRITLLAMPFLLAPIVILLFYPLVDRILNTLSGVAVGGGF